jgi:hypothetical protein
MSLANDMPAVPKFFFRLAAVLGSIGLLLRALYRQPESMASNTRAGLADFADTEPAVHGGL